MPDLAFAIIPRRTPLEEPADEAIAAFRAAADAHPHEPDYVFMLGEALARAGRLEDATQALGEACAGDPGRGEYLRLLGSVWLARGEPEHAERVLQRALEKAPREAATLSHLALVWARLGRHADASQAAQQACRLAPRDSESQRCLGVVRWQAGDSRAALQALRTATRLAPQSADCQHDLGLALEALGQPHEALRAFERVGAVDPSVFAVRPAARAALDRCRQAATLDELDGAGGRRRALATRALAMLAALVNGLGGALRSVPRVAIGLLLVLLAHAVYGLGTAWLTHWRLQDRLSQLARVPHDDVRVRAGLEREIARLGLGPHLRASQCALATGAHWRQISCEYRRPVSLAPGLAPRLRFKAQVEVPVLFEPEPLML